MQNFYRTLVIVLVFAACIGKVNTTYAQTSDEKDIFSIGVGFGGGLGGPGISYDLLPNYSGTVAPGFMFNYEHIFEKYFGIGGVISIAGASLTANNIPYSVTDPLGNVIAAGTLKDVSKGTYIGFAARPLYHFKASDNFDPYAGLVMGFTFNSISSTVTTTSGTYSEGGLFPGLLFGAIVGGRFYFTKNIGVWAELGYCGMPDYLVNAGVTYRMGKF